MRIYELSLIIDKNPSAFLLICGAVVSGTDGVSDDGGETIGGTSFFCT